jgi:benzoylformate decarboxylase
MYVIQGLWTAAHFRLPVTFLICNIAQYKILKIGANQLRLPAAQEGRYVGLDLVDPEVDFVRLAESLGVAAQRVTEPEEVSELLAESLAGDEPRLLDVPVQRGVPDRLQYG